MKSVQELVVNPLIDSVRGQVDRTIKTVLCLEEDFPSGDSRESLSANFGMGLILLGCSLIGDAGNDEDQAEISRLIKEFEESLSRAVADRDDRIPY